MKTPQKLSVKDLNHHGVDLFELYPHKALLILLYNNQCLGCTGRAIPLAYQIQNDFQEIQVIGLHVNFSKTPTTQEDIASIFTTPELPFPIYLDEQATLYHKFQSEGTPQWLIFDKNHHLFRSIFGSQANAQNRILYALEDLNS